MTKKIYFAPRIKVKVVDNEPLMQASGNQTSIGVSNDTNTNTNDWAASKRNTIWNEGLEE